MTLLTPEQLAAAQIEIQKDCANSRDIRVRRYAASSPLTPADVLIKLSGEKLLREEVFNNPNTPPAVKMWLQGGYGEMSLQEFMEATK